MNIIAKELVNYDIPISPVRKPLIIDYDENIKIFKNKNDSRIRELYGKDIAKKYFK